jgi:hypothetical protein
MLISGVFAAVLGASSLVAAAPTETSASDLMLDLNRQATKALENTFTQSNGRSAHKKCTAANVAVRRDW